MPGITRLTRPGSQGRVNVRFNHGLLESQMRFRVHVSTRVGSLAPDRLKLVLTLPHQVPFGT